MTKIELIKEEVAKIQEEKKEVEEEAKVRGNTLSLRSREEKYLESIQLKIFSKSVG